MTKRGFTLIELLVVMTIMGILISLSVASFSVARRQSRDATRKSNLETMRSGLEMYKADCGSYPLAGQVVGGETLVASPGCPEGKGSIYISNIPVDPKTSDWYPYTTKPPIDGTTYTLCATLEQGGTAVSGCGSCGSAGTCNYEVTNP